MAASDVTQILNAVANGDRQAASRLMPMVYEELRKLAAQRVASESPGQTLQATALVHDAYLRLVDVDRPQQWSGRGHFFAAAAEAMRRILVENARRKRGPKAGGGRERMDLGGVELAVPAGVPADALDLLALDEALGELERAEPRKAALVKLRFFAGLTNDQAAAALSVSLATAENDWAYAKAWLRLQLGGNGDSDGSGGGRRSGPDSSRPG